MQPTVIVEKLKPEATIPYKPKTQTDAGFDCYCLDHGKIIPPNGGSALLHTGLKVQIPEGYCIQVNPRSGMASKHGLVVGARIIDSAYRGELRINIINHGKEPFEVSRNLPLVQLLVLRCAANMVEGVVNDITDRGEDGFGSTNGALIRESLDKDSDAMNKGLAGLTARSSGLSYKKAGKAVIEPPYEVQLMSDEELEEHKAALSVQLQVATMGEMKADTLKVGPMSYFNEEESDHLKRIREAVNLAVSNKVRLTLDHEDVKILAKVLGKG